MTSKQKMQPHGCKSRACLMLMLALAAVLFLAGCAGNEAAQLDEPEMKQLVHDLSTGARPAKAASISSTRLMVESLDGERTVFDLPGDAFFVSIAPYYEVTHPCAIHSLTGCQGELPGEAFDLVVEDETGTPVMEKTVETGDNGFMDLWLPRNGTFRVTISREGRTAKADISTFEGDPTCITTMQLL